MRGSWPTYLDASSPVRFFRAPVMFYTTFSVFVILSLSTTSLSQSLDDVGLLKRAGTRCGAGAYSSTGNTPCTNCPAGTYTRESGQTKCTAARAGYYVPTAGATSELPCRAGTYSGTTGLKACLSCPPGFMCPSDALAIPQQCSPGRYSTGGVKDCPKCSAGFFNNIHKATSCCPCPAGWFNPNAGNTNCQSCPNQTPYCGPGNDSMNKCSAKPGVWAPSKTSGQGSGGTCPPSAPQPSSKPKRFVKPKPKCQMNEKACPVYRDFEIVEYSCIDVQSNLESCGDCLAYSYDGFFSLHGGQDCTAIPFVDDVSCHKGTCKIGMCQPGFVLSHDGASCINDFLK